MGKDQVTVSLCNSMKNINTEARDSKLFPSRARQKTLPTLGPSGVCRDFDRTLKSMMWNAELRGERCKPSFPWGLWHPLSGTDRTDRLKNQQRSGRRDTIDQLDRVDVPRTRHPAAPCLAITIGSSPRGSPAGPRGWFTFHTRSTESITVAD